jgi:pimeloyl-ACP methyl ester carboxylesterase
MAEVASRSAAADARSLGKYDPSFTVAGATTYSDDVPKAEIHFLEAGHFALDEATDEIACLVRNFLERL